MAQRLGSSWPTHLVLSQDLAYWGLNAVGGEVPSGTGQIWFILMAFWWHIDGKKNLVNTCKYHKVELVLAYMSCRSCSLAIFIYTSLTWVF
jgi:hypothetical protein